ncbi:MAG TPA: hypothetical protein VLO07_02580 [Thermoanaerobaculia bacterium]|nr:hypothetical protein [Thermoanaerobaculia bacterium]
MSDVTDSEMAGTATEPARTRRRTAARRKARAAARKTVSRRKSPSVRGKAGFESFVKAWAKRAAGAGVTLAALSSGGIEKTREALGKAGTASRKTMDRMAREWKQMDPRRRAQVVAALLAALAAVSAPIVRSQIKKR